MSLAELLAAKERRAARQAAFGARRALLCFTVVMPGPDKAGPFSRRIFAAGLAALRSALAAESIAVLKETQVDDALGPEAYFDLDAPAGLVKRLAILVEEGSPPGRLFDLDVFGEDGRPLSRTEYGLPERRCLVCEKPASLCYRERAHSAEELSAAVGRRIAGGDAKASSRP